MQAIYANDPKQFAAAMEKGADPLMSPDGLALEGRTPFHHAAMTGCTQIVALVLLRHPDCVNRTEHRFNKTALHFAATHGYVDTVKFLLSKNADPIPRAADLWTPLHYSAENGHPEVIKILLDNGADPDLPNETGQTPLHLAAVFNSTSALKVLVTRYGSKARQKMEDASNAIIESSAVVPKAIARLIAALSITPCNLLLEDDWGKTAYDWADECMDWLEAEGDAVALFEQVVDLGPCDQLLTDIVECSPMRSSTGREARVSVMDLEEPDRTAMNVSTTPRT